MTETTILPPGTQVCTQCYYVGPPRGADGLMAVGAIGMLFGQSAFRGANSALIQGRIGRCPKCGQQALVPADSPRATQILGELQASGQLPKFEYVAPNAPVKTNAGRGVMLGCLGAIAVVVVIMIMLSALHLT